MAQMIKVGEVGFGVAGEPRALGEKFEVRRAMWRERRNIAAALEKVGSAATLRAALHAAGGAHFWALSVACSSARGSPLVTPPWRPPRLPCAHAAGCTFGDVSHPSGADERFLLFRVGFAATARHIKLRPPPPRISGAWPGCAPP